MLRVNPVYRRIGNNVGKNDMGSGFTILYKIVNKFFKVKLVFEYHFHNDIFIAGDSIAINDLVERSDHL